MAESTIHDIARRLDVSATTVWRAINNRPRVSLHTRTRVLAEVQRVGYQPSLVAQNLAQGRTQTLGVVVPTVRNSVHAALVRAAEQAAFDRDYNIVLCDTDFNLDRELKYLDLLVRRRVEGVLLVPFAKGMRSDEARLDRFKQAGIAVVCMQQCLAGTEVPQVVPDNFCAAREMTRHLIWLGHRRIAFMHGGLSPWFASMNERLEGYRAALEEADLPVDPELIVEAGTFESILPDDEEGGGVFHAKRLESLLRQKSRPTAVFAVVDVLAIKLMSLARSIGMRVPEDLAVAGFDNIQMSAFTEPPLTTVRHPATEVGQRAAELLFKTLAGKGSSGNGSVIERVPCELIIRRSCGATGKPTVIA